jgi:beta-1,4-mannosyl-glycoprotein beta-1,4-N-acetylglucosaminyltransferase
MKIFDTFTFFNELDLLELRMNILGDVVDYFVINEANITFTGKEKPLYYYENRERFKKWEHKIIHHVTVDNNETLEKYWEGVPYHRSMIEENIYKLPMYYQRDCFHKDSAIYALLDRASDDDIIITSDADEIANPKVIKIINEWFNPDNHYVLRGPIYYYCLNLLMECETKWMGPRISSMKMLKSMSVDKLRQSHQDAWIIDDAAWSWSFFGNADTVRAKMDAYAHQENNLPQFRNNMEERIEKGIDPFGRNYLYTPRIVSIDDTFPEYIVQNIDKFAKFIK